jgi:hypothetical protein
LVGERHVVGGSPPDAGHVDAAGAVVRRIRFEDPVDRPAHRLGTVLLACSDHHREVDALGVPAESRDRLSCEHVREAGRDADTQDDARTTLPRDRRERLDVRELLGRRGHVDDGNALLEAYRVERAVRHVHAQRDHARSPAAEHGPNARSIGDIHAHRGVRALLRRMPRAHQHAEPGIACEAIRRDRPTRPDPPTTRTGSALP